MSVTPILTYRFIAHYNDGTKLDQEPNTPQEKHFGDIQQEKLSKFELVGKEGRFSVDLKTGEFNLKGEKLYFDKYPFDGESRLIYFRRVRQFSTSSYHLMYCFGLKCTKDGVDHQALIWIDPEDGKFIVGGRK